MIKPPETILDTRSLLTSIERDEVAYALCALYLEQIASSKPDSEDIATLLWEYMNRVLDNSAKQNDTYNSIDANNSLDEFNAAEQRKAQDFALEHLARRNYEIVSKDPAKHNQYLAHMARLGQLIELSGHLARENFFDRKRIERQKKKGIGVPGGIERIFCKVEDEIGGDMFTKSDRRYIFNTPQEAIQYLSTPVLELSLTQHPTNIFTLDTILLVRQMHDAALQVCRTPDAQLEAITEQMQKFAANELTPVVIDDMTTRISNFDAEDELNFTLDTVSQIDTNLPDVYAPYETALRNRFQGKYTDDMRWDFFLDLRINSWTIGDKDGNQNVRAEHLLLATVKHRQKGIELALKHLKQIQEKGITLEAHWSQQLEETQKRLHDIKDELDTMQKASDGIDLILSQNEFDRINAALANALGKNSEGKSKDWAEFEREYLSALKTAGQGAKGERASVLLKAYRSMKTFGLRAARIEFRETADLYSIALAHIMGEPYASLSEAEQTQLLDALIIENPDYLDQLGHSFLKSCKDAKELRQYKKDKKIDPDVITYHTLKRFEVAASNPDMYHDNILAECKGEHHMLVNLALQKTVRGANGELLRQHIVPLFEEYGTLKQISSILKNAYLYRSYRDHSWELAERNFPEWKLPEENLNRLRQKFQIAHSDNIRRSGTPAGRGNIHSAHYDVPAEMKKFEPHLAQLYREDGRKQTEPLSLDLEIFEGLSLSHVLRGGGRSLSALCNSFKIHRHTKITAQGADQQSYLGLSSSFNRLATRFFVHSAKEIALEENTIPPAGSNPKIEKAISVAFEASMPDYVDKHFGRKEIPGGKITPKNAGMGWLLAHPIVNYAVYSVTGNRGLRSASRGGAIEPTKFVDTINDTRAIGIAENMFDADLLGTWLGSENLLANLSRQVLNEENYQSFRLQVNTAFNSSVCGTSITEASGERLLTPQELNGLYKTSAQFRDVIDQMACGLVASNVNRLQTRLERAERKGIPMNFPLGYYVYMTLPKDYIKASELVLGAFGIDYNKGELERVNTLDRMTYMRHMVATYAIPAYATEYGVKGRFSTASVLARDEILSTNAYKNLGDEELRALSNIVAARMVSSHGRVFTGEDIFYSSARLHSLQNNASAKQPVPFS